MRTRFIFVIIAGARTLFVRAWVRGPVATVTTPGFGPFWIHAQLTRGLGLRLFRFTYARGGITKNSFVARKFASLSRARKCFFATNSYGIFGICGGTLYNFKTGMWDENTILHGTLRNLGRGVRFTGVNGVIQTTIQADSFVFFGVVKRFAITRDNKIVWGSICYRVVFGWFVYAIANFTIFAIRWEI